MGRVSLWLPTEPSRWPKESDAPVAYRRRGGPAHGQRGSGGRGTAPTAAGRAHWGAVPPLHGHAAKRTRAPAVAHPASSHAHWRRACRKPGWPTGGGDEQSGHLGPRPQPPAAPPPRRAAPPTGRRDRPPLSFPSLLLPRRRLVRQPYDTDPVPVSPLLPLSPHRSSSIPAPVQTWRATASQATCPSAVRSRSRYNPDGADR